MGRTLGVILLASLLVGACVGEGSLESTLATDTAPTTTASEPATTAPATTTPAADATTSTEAETAEAQGTVQLAESLMAAYLSFDPAALTEVAGNAVLPDVFYLQALFEALNYQVLMAVTCDASGNNATCTFQGEDDISRLLGYEYGEVWTVFTASGEILTVEPRLSDESDEWYFAFLGWANDNSPELFEEGGPCAGFAPDNDPVECAPAMLEAAQAYLESDAYVAP